MSKKSVVFGSSLTIAIMLGAGLYYVFGISKQSMPQANIDQSFEPTLNDERLKVGVSKLDAKIEELVSKLNMVAEKQLQMDEQLQELIDSEHRIGDRAESQREDQLFVDSEQESLEFQRKRMDQRSMLDYRVTENTEDPWGIDKANRVSTILKEVPEIQVAKDILTQCSETLCRVDVVLSSDANDFQREDLDLMLTANLAGDFTESTLYVERLADGSEKKSYYLARKGYTLRGEPIVASQENNNR